MMSDEELRSWAYGFSAELNRLGNERGFILLIFKLESQFGDLIHGFSTHMTPEERILVVETWLRNQKIQAELKNQINEIGIGVQDSIEVKEGL